MARGDLTCATELLQNAGTEPELELWIETLRAQGDGLQARRAMKRFVEGVDRGQSTLFPERLEDWIVEDNPVRMIDVFVDELDLAEEAFWNNPAVAAA